MGFRCGIVGLPNVGKSTIFNAITACNVEAANYPFCTIDPNTGVVPVPDSRLAKLCAIAKSIEIIPTAIEFVDIAGLVKGASQGEGLGNQFLGHIRTVDALIHVVRCFDDENVVHVHGSVGPRRDVEVIEMELMLADLSSVEKRIDRVSKAAKGGDKLLKIEHEALEFAKVHLEKGTMLRKVLDQGHDLAALDLLTTKPVLYVANVSESNVTANPDASSTGALKELVELAKSEGCEVVVISGKVESEISQLSEDDKAVFLSDLGLEMSGLERLAAAGYRLLKLLTFFTVGPKETHAWTCPLGTFAPQAAGVIHSDFEKGFIRAEIIGYQDYIDCGGEVGAKEKGKLRVEGKTYQVLDGDVVHFRFNV